MAGILIRLSDSVRDGICQAQTTGGAGNLIINGVFVDRKRAGNGVTHAKLNDDAQYLIGLYSTGNLSAVNFTVVGKDVNGNTISEVVAGPNAGYTTSIKYFYYITNIGVDAAVTSPVEIGNQLFTASEGNVSFMTRPITVGSTGCQGFALRLIAPVTTLDGINVAAWMYDMEDAGNPLTNLTTLYPSLRAGESVMAATTSTNRIAGQHGFPGTFFILGGGGGGGVIRVTPLWVA